MRGLVTDPNMASSRGCLALSASVGVGLPLLDDDKGSPGRLPTPRLVHRQCKVASGLLLVVRSVRKERFWFWVVWRGGRGAFECAQAAVPPAAAGGAFRPAAVRRRWPRPR